MSCIRAYEVDLDELVLERNGNAYLEFADHCESCADCARELRAQTALLDRLAGRDPIEHPEPSLLLALHQAGDTMPGAVRTELRSHLESCGVCRDGLRAFQRLESRPASREEATGLAVRIRARLAPWIGDTGLLPLAQGAIALALAVGLGVYLIPTGSDSPGTYRGDAEMPTATETSLGDADVVELSLVEDVESEAALGLVDDREVALALIAGADPFESGADLEVFLEREDGRVAADVGPLQGEVDENLDLRVIVPAGALEPGIYRVRVRDRTDPNGRERSYPLAVR